MIRSGWVKFLLFVSGLGLSFLAFAARWLGIDHNDDWGVSRFLLLGLGVVCLGGAGWLHDPQRWTNAFLGSRLWRWTGARQTGLLPRFCRWVWHCPPMRWLRGVCVALDRAWHRLPPIAWLQADARREAGVWTVLTVMIVALIYVWLISVGYWTQWPQSTTYTDRQADAFLAGQLHLLEEPDPRLLELEDVYDFAQRQYIPQLWDASLYQGRYYLYWGPVPALILAGIKALFSGWAPLGVVGDELLVFGFTFGTFLFGVLILLRLWRAWFPRLPGSVVGPVILAFGLSNPMPWLLTRPGVYEVAITGGQFFLLFAFWMLCEAFVVRVRRRRPSLACLALAGAGLALAVGCRATLAIAVVWVFLSMLFAMLFPAVRGQRWNLRGLRHVAAQVWQRLLALGLPLFGGAAGLAWYNWARFGSIFEFGHRYQLTGMNLNAVYAAVMSPVYLLPNLYSYLVRPFSLQPEFPYVIAVWISEQNWPFFIRLPELYYYPEPLTGLLPTLPYAWFGLAFFVAAVWVAYRRWKTRRQQGLVRSSAEWGSLFLGGLVLFEATPVLLFVVSSMRYQADFVPSLMLLSGVSFFSGLNGLAQRPALRRLWAALGWILVLVSALLGVALAFTGYVNRFESLNPRLYYWLITPR